MELMKTTEVIKELIRQGWTHKEIGTVININEEYVNVQEFWNSLFEVGGIGPLTDPGQTMGELKLNVNIEL